jgi:hypothetical protein
MMLSEDGYEVQTMPAASKSGGLQKQYAALAAFEDAGYPRN